MGNLINFKIKKALKTKVIFVKSISKEKLDDLIKSGFLVVIK
jgi:hypothetical protein